MQNISMNYDVFPQKEKKKNDVFFMFGSATHMVINQHHRKQGVRHDSSELRQAHKPKNPYLKFSIHNISQIKGV